MLDYSSLSGSRSSVGVFETLLFLCLSLLAGRDLSGSSNLTLLHFACSALQVSMGTELLAFTSWCLLSVSIGLGLATPELLQLAVVSIGASLVNGPTPDHLAIGARLSKNVSILPLSFFSMSDLSSEKLRTCCPWTTVGFSGALVLLLRLQDSAACPDHLVGDPTVHSSMQSFILCPICSLEGAWDCFRL